MGAGARPRPVRAGEGARGGRALRARRRHVGRVRHQHGRRRGDGPPAPGGPGVVRRAPRRAVRGGLAPRLVRLHRRPAPARAAGRLPVVPHPEDLVEPGERLPAPHLLVGGHRRHPGADPLPAGRHLHEHPVCGRARPRGSELQGQGCREPLAGAVRPRRRRRRPHPRDARPRHAHGRPRRLAPGRRRVPHRVLHRGRGRVRRRTGVGRRAVPRDPPRHLHLAGPHQAGQPAVRAPAARGGALGGDGGGAGSGAVPRRDARRGVAHGPAAPVPRHPARQLDRVGAPGGGRHLRRGGHDARVGDRRPRQRLSRDGGTDEIAFNAGPLVARRCARPRCGGGPRDHLDPSRA